RLAKHMWIRLIERSNLECASAIHVTAEIEARELQEFGFALPPIVTIPNGVALPSRAATQTTIGPEIRSLCQRRPLILYLGRINWKKNLIELVRAVREIPHVHLAIVGHDENRHGETVADAASALGITDRVTVLPRPIVGIDKDALLAACDLFVLPSLSENFGNAALEAASYGKPIIVSENAGVAGFVRECQCGLVCEPNADGLSRSIAELLENAERAKLMGERGRAAAVNN